MKTVQDVLEPEADGSVRLAVPAELRKAGKLRVIAWFAAAGEPVAGDEMPEGPGKWAVHARGIAKLREGESTDDARFESLETLI
jgi:hypothetical protein